MLGRRIAARPRPPATVRDLEIALLEEWNSIPQSLIDNLITSISNSTLSIKTYCVHPITPNMLSPVIPNPRAANQYWSVDQIAQGCKPVLVCGSNSTGLHNER
ncbi:hypothetical protein TNCV_1377701 [Trichonephila clavipes]|nr:hypothetical protein TNCV_1377701 [Trichonephila clavipes]